MTWLVNPSLSSATVTANDKLNPGPGTHPELVGPEFVDVGALPGCGLVPEAELQEELVPARQQHLTPLLPVRCELLPTDKHRSISFTETDALDDVSFPQG